MVISNSNDEQELLLQLQSGNREAFEAIYHLYSKRIYGNILRMVKDPDIAQEFLQDVFLKVWEKRTEVNSDLSFKAYLFQISRNLVYNYFRRETIQRQVEHYLSSHMTEFQTEQEDNLQYKQSKELIEKAINQLPPQRRKIYIMCKIEGKSYQEVSELLKISTSTVNDHIVKATKFLRENQDFSEAALTFIFILSILKK